MNTLLVLTLSGSVLALLLLALRYLILRKMPSTVYYYAWLLVLLRFVLPLPGLIPMVAVTPISAPESAAVVSVSPSAPEENTVVPMPLVPAAVSPAQEDPDAVSEESSSTVPIQAETTVTNTGKSFSIDWKSPAFWLALWAAGAVVTFGLTVFSYLRFSASLRNRLQIPDRSTQALYTSLPGRKPSLYSCRALKTPLMCGVLHPRIILPARPTNEELLTNILRHELMHYHRRDTLYKWIAVAILSLHWFNPLSWLIRREISRSCELSCDEMLLRSMNRAEKQSYGNTLLNLAASSSLPAGVVATTFSTEKKNLKERLEQIMNYKKSAARVLASVLALVLLAGCGAAAGPAAEFPAEKADVTITDDTVVHVSTVDEFLAAIAPNAVIELAAGEYDLSTASDYGADTHSSYYSWNGVWDENGKTSAELLIQSVDNLTIRGGGMEETTIAAVPRYANVIRFVGCKDLILTDLTAGHTMAPGYCTGGVLYFDNCSNISLDTCGLYGCGTIGVQAKDCSNLMVTCSSIYECSYGAVSVNSCRNVSVDGCEIFAHGTRAGQGEAINLFDASYSDGFVVHNSRIYDNRTQYLMRSDYTRDVLFLSNEVSNNSIASAAFYLQQYNAVVDGCSFTDNHLLGGWYISDGVYAADIDGNILAGDAFEAMTLREIDPGTAVTPVKADPAPVVPAGATVEVTTVDEFLAAIGPDRNIILKGELFDLSTASNYGVIGGEYYFWNQNYDGPELVIHDVSGLSIGTSNADRKATTLAAIPRYANVLNFRNCEKIQLMDFTAGHTKEPGVCAGGVLYFDNCNDVTVYKMGLYGCGILGIQASQCTKIAIDWTEIYECSQGAGYFYKTDGISFDSCDIHDVPSPALRFIQCGDKIWNNEPIGSGLEDMFDVGSNWELVPYKNEPEESFYAGSVEDLNNPFAEEPAQQYEKNSPQVQFAASVQKAFADGDWEALVDKISFPIQLFLDGYSITLADRDDFLNVKDELTGKTPFTSRVCERIANASLDEFGQCIYGNTCCDHLIAFACAGNDIRTDNLYITAISTTTPLWPGRAMNSNYVQVVPTPMP
ncbi:MAG: right-handed parallel beta-helix repeat-containing protein [Oscillospiraceae bacterium]|nr:right-handed parallel beta-helix repeat-containing protein [Oscillospiraceae bacterium]